jgi:hypothetical protein
VSKLLYKLNLYNLSLIPLYIIFILQYIKLEPFERWNNGGSKAEYFSLLVTNNWQVVFFIVLIVLALLSYEIFQNDGTYGQKASKQFHEITASNFDHLTFLSTYIIPLITFNLNEPRSFIVVISLLLMIGVIYLKSNLYYLNPTLLLFGYKIYKAKSDNKAVILIIKGTIHDMSHMYKYKDLGNNIYLIKG